MFTLRFKTDNAAFTDKPAEISRILRELAAQIETRERFDCEIRYGNVRDVNGNTIGNFSLVNTD